MSGTERKLTDMDAILRQRVDVLLKWDATIEHDAGGDSYKQMFARRREELATMPIPPYGQEIPDREMLETIDALTPKHGHIWTTVYDLEDVFGVDSEAVERSAHSLVRREVIFGCDCGCRGDYSLDDAGLYDRPTVDELLAGAGFVRGEAH